MYIFEYLWDVCVVSPKLPYLPRIFQRERVSGSARVGRTSRRASLDWWFSEGSYPQKIMEQFSLANDCDLSWFIQMLGRYQCLPCFPQGFPSSSDARWQPGDQCGTIAEIWAYNLAIIHINIVNTYWIILIINIILQKIWRIWPFPFLSHGSNSSTGLSTCGRKQKKQTSHGLTMQ